MFLHSSQHGFCSGRSVDTNLLELYDHITKLLILGCLLTWFCLTFLKLLTKCVTSNLQLNYMQSSLKRNPCSGSLIFFICNISVFSNLMTLVIVFFLPLHMFWVSQRSFFFFYFNNIKDIKIATWNVMACKNNYCIDSYGNNWRIDSMGSVLGPTLFNIFINDAPSLISSKSTLYADNL